MSHHHSQNSLAVSGAHHPSIPALAFPSKKVYLTQSLPVRIGPDKAYQVARSTKFYFIYYILFYFYKLKETKKLKKIIKT